MPNYQLPLFTQLDIEFAGEPIPFYGHELLAIANKTLARSEGDMKILPSRFHKALEERMLNPYSAMLKNEYGDDVFFRHTALPIGINLPETLQQIRFLTLELCKPNHRISDEGWWLLFGGHILFVNNANAQDGQFYISDHGEVYSFFEEYKSMMFLTPWIASTQSKSAYLSELSNLKSSYRYDAQTDQVEGPLDSFIQDFKKNICLHLPRDIAPLHDLLVDNIPRPRGSKYPIPICLLHNPEFKNNATRFLKTLLKLEQTSSGKFTEEILQRCGEDIEIADRVIKNHLIRALANEVNEGNRMSLYRPLSVDGEAHAGRTYKAFHQELQQYQAKTGTTDKALAAFARNILLCQREVYRRAPDFFHPLVTALFISEPLRNPLSILSSIMLLDLIENQIRFHDLNGTNLYTFGHMLVSPFDPNEDEAFLDLYGEAINVDKFAGIHPMVQWKAVAQTQRPLADNQRLTNVRQKEASLFLHWINAVIQSQKNQAIKPKRTLHTLYFAPAPKKPQYDELVLEKDKPSRALELAEKKIDKLKRTIKIKEKQSINAEKEQSELEHLERRAAFLKKKAIVQQSLIEPLLWFRLLSESDCFYHPAEEHASKYITEILQVFASIQAQFISSGQATLPRLRDYPCTRLEDMNDGAFAGSYLDSLKLPPPQEEVPAQTAKADRYEGLYFFKPPKTNTVNHQNPTNRK